MTVFINNFIVLFLLCAGGTISGGFSASAGPMQILTIGDSLLASHRISRRAVSHALARQLGAQVTDRSFAGARVIYRLPFTGQMGLSIPNQYRGGDWDWVVVNGGGNDLLWGCGCNSCARKMRKLISADGSRGEIPKLVNKIRQTGAKVIYVGYLRSPGVSSFIEHCKDEGDELDARLRALANADDGVFFVSLEDMVPDGDRSYHTMDMVHPSLKASREIGIRVARLIGK